MRKRNQRMLPVLHETTGNVMAWLWPRFAGQIAYYGNPPQAIVPHTQHAALQPIIDILARDAAKRAAA